ncbi:MAG: EFR1 family ferrodoxin [Chitinivibrionales bacterium]|nr:EFR1 family ferrodoxin [Chitinivibrionales bacterium]
MKKIVIYYFSGTGNTEYVVQLLCDQFTKLGDICMLLRMEDVLKESKAIDAAEYDFTGICYPVHAFDAPQIVYDFIARLPKPNGTRRAFILKCPGDPILNAGSTTKIRRTLKNRGYAVFHESIAVMPANVVIQFNDDFKRALYGAVYRKTAIWAGEIIAGKRRLQPNNVILDIVTALFSAGEKRGCRQWGKKMKVSERCTMCRKCVALCPAGNITAENGAIHFNGTCNFCLRCIYRCPERAIKFPLLETFIVLRQGYSPPAFNERIVEEKRIALRGYFKHYQRYLDKD